MSRLRAQIELKEPDIDTNGWTFITGRVRMGTKYVSVAGKTNIPLVTGMERKYFTKIPYTKIKSIEFLENLP